MALTQLYIMKCDTTLTQELPGFPVSLALTENLSTVLSCFRFHKLLNCTGNAVDRGCYTFRHCRSYQ